MCGIAGISLCRSADLELLERSLRHMTQALRHRGPDDEGREVVRDAAGTPAVLLGNTRLAILDLSSAGHQPMLDPATGNWIVLNGEIYNHVEIRRALGPRAGPWRSSSDTETLLQAYAAWGGDCLQRARGMFAVAIWDARRETLWCARDRLGIKPLYYAITEDAFVFASEVRALLASRLVRRRLHLRGLAGYVRFGSLPEPLTLIEGVSSLPAGHWMRVRAGRVEEVSAYWTPQTKPLGAASSETPREVRSQLERAVREHLLSDVAVGAFLSGGIDSSIVTALAARGLGSSLETFTVGFREGAMDESAYAREVAERNGLRHHRLLLSDDEVSAMVPAAVSAMDLPSADGVNTFIVARAAAEAGARVVLSGLGGDELFGGYRSFRLLPRAQHLARVFGPLVHVLLPLSKRRNGRRDRMGEVLGSNVSLRHRYEALRSFWSMPELRSMGLLPDPVVYRADDPGERIGLARRVSSLELTGYMRSTLLRDGDAMTMAHSIELRVPMLDHELVEYCLAVGAAALSTRRRPKELLLRAAGDLLPEAILTRPKQGFVLPMDRWMRTSLRGFVAEGLSHLASTRLLRPGWTIRAERTFEAGRLPWARLWEAAVLGHWLEANGSWDVALEAPSGLFVDGDGIPPSGSGSGRRLTDRSPARQVEDR